MEGLDHARAQRKRRFGQESEGGAQMETYQIAALVGLRQQGDTPLGDRQTRGHPLETQIGRGTHPYSTDSG